MKVSDLFAEIGFKVDTKGLSDFENAMKGVQKSIKGCVNGLKDLVSAAEKIASAVNKIRISTSISDKELERRYRAETYYLRSMGIQARGVGALKKAQAPFVERNLEYKEANLAYKQEKLAMQQNGGLFSQILSGNVWANIITGVLGGIKNVLIGSFKMLVNLFREAIASAMAYRDYMNFTGRSYRSLSDLMGMTTHTTNMTPQEIMKDAQSFQKQYWDMWFGGGNPEAFMRLGVVPTGNGEADLRNVLKAIYDVTGKGTNTGLAASLLGQFGLNEQYMNIFAALREGKESDYTLITEKEIDAMKEANEKLRAFSQTMDQVKMKIVSTLLDSGIGDILNTLADVLKTMISLFRGGAFKGKSFWEAIQMTGEVMSTSPEAREAMMKTGKYYEGPSEGFGAKALKWLFRNSRFEDSIKEWAEKDFKQRQSDFNTKMVNITNQFDASGRTPEEVGEMARSVLTGESQQFGIDNMTLMGSTI